MKNWEINIGSVLEKEYKVPNSYLYLIIALTQLKADMGTSGQVFLQLLLEYILLIGHLNMLENPLLKAFTIV